MHIQYIFNADQMQFQHKFNAHSMQVQCRVNTFNATSISLDIYFHGGDCSKKSNSLSVSSKSARSEMEAFWKRVAIVYYVWMHTVSNMLQYVICRFPMFLFKILNTVLSELWGCCLWDSSQAQAMSASTCSDSLTHTWKYWGVYHGHHNSKWWCEFCGCSASC